MKLHNAHEGIDAPERHTSELRHIIQILSDNRLIVDTIDD